MPQHPERCVTKPMLKAHKDPAKPRLVQALGHCPAG